MKNRNESILQEKIGSVVSDKMKKTRIVVVESIRQDPLYKKKIRSKKRFAAHDPREVAKTGDVVRIRQTRPLSATKRWIITEIIRQAKTV